MSAGSAALVTGVDVPSGAPARIATPRPDDPRLSRLSLNQMTTQRWGIREAVAGCVRAGIPSIGLWRAPVQEIGQREAAKIVADAGLRVSSLCRGGRLTVADTGARKAALDDNRRAIDEAATVGTNCLALVVGGLQEGPRDLAAARERVVEGVAALAPYAGERGVRLAIEPLHPMYCADRAVVSTLGQALDMAELFPPEQVGVVVDTFHLWWDPDIWRQIRRAGGESRAMSRIASFQISDWVLPLAADVLLSRGMMGDGYIDFRQFRRTVEDAGYPGDIEVEIFNADVWAADGDAVLATMTRRYVSHVLD